MATPIYVVIATSNQRTSWLIGRSLRSVYRQTSVSPSNVQVLIVDDNRNESELAIIDIQVTSLRREMNLDEKDFPTRVIRNIRTRYFSGSGAWNTGIFIAYEEDSDAFVAILDDDDEYLPNHLGDCTQQLEEYPDWDGVFQEINWHFEDHSELRFPLQFSDVTAESFYIGNPGIQGSNLMVRSRTLAAIHGFDESLQSATDRDLLIRLLEYWNNDLHNIQRFGIISEIGVIHYAHGQQRVTTDVLNKSNGLNRFYEKHKTLFSESHYLRSLKRASFLFKYGGYNPFGQCMVILVTMHNNAKTVERAISSIYRQLATRRPLYILVSDDESTDTSREIVESLSRKYGNIHLERNFFGSASANRNHLQRRVLEIFPECVLIGRLDADDALHERDILQKIEQLWEQSDFDVLLMSNRQLLHGAPTGFINRPEEDLMQPECLLQRVRAMSEGQWQAELPSCNVFLRPQVALPFKEVSSAEDHLNLAEYLLRSDLLNIDIRPDWIYCDYSIDKHIDSPAHEKEKRRNARIELLKIISEMATHTARRKTALRLLQNWLPGEYEWLGAGFSGVVFHDERWVYKVHLPLATNNFNEIDNVLLLRSKLHVFRNRRHFYELRDIVEIDNTLILIYPFEKSEKVIALSREDMISFLAEMWQMKIVCRSITKENNFVRVDGTIKLIDYEIESYDDNLFLNTAARAFIQLEEFSGKGLSMNKLKRSTINQFDLPELEGFNEFVFEIFSRCAKMSFSDTDCQSVVTVSESFDKVDYRSAPHAVSLLIKACIQDSKTLYRDVRDLVSVCISPIQFEGRYLLLDLYKEDDFLRQYTDLGSKQELLSEAKRLIRDGFIDRVIIPPTGEGEIHEVNLSWFGIPGSATHTVKGVPVTSQVYAFGEVPGDYILQIDLDVLIGFTRGIEDYLKKMINALELSPNALTMGFQIYHGKEVMDQLITGQSGEIPPDVRCCLVHKKRMLAARPFPNELNDHGWEHSWYRSLEEHQSKRGMASLRGGPNVAFYLHVQNYRKNSPWAWQTIRQSLKQGNLPEVQVGKPEAEGDIFDWSIPKRQEKLVVVLYISEHNGSTFLESLTSIVGQQGNFFGVVLINNTGYEDFVSESVSQTALSRDNLTIINFADPLPYNEAIYRAIHYYLTDQDSFVCLLRQGDVLLYPELFGECLNRLDLYDADVLVGKELSERTIRDSGLSRSDFIHPRNNPETLANGLAIFRKYLFDSLSLFDLKEKIEGLADQIPEFSRVKQSHVWMDDTSGMSIMVPVIELSRNPIRFDHFNVLRRRVPSKEMLSAWARVISGLKAKKEGAWEKGRKTFMPNVNKIELDITYDCNLKCFHCNRSCTQAPTQASMTLEQIWDFIDESIASEKRWQLINILGGEPTLHPQFDEIVRILLDDYVSAYSPQTKLQVTSNGFGDEVRQKLDRLPSHPNLVINYYSFKDDRTVPYFTPFNIAPVDDKESNDNDYSKGCWVTSYCGIGLNHLGYFACGVAGGIERILKNGLGIHSLTELNEELLRRQLEVYCRLCGNFSAYGKNQGDFMERAEKAPSPRTGMSESWKRLYKNYNEGQ